MVKLKKTFKTQPGEYVAEISSVKLTKSGVVIQFTVTDPKYKEKQKVMHYTIKNEV